MNKFFKNFSKYLLIASLGFASTQAADGEKEPQRTKETKKLDKIIYKKKLVIAGGIFIAILQGLTVYLAFLVYKNKKKVILKKSNSHSVSTDEFVGDDFFTKKISIANSNYIGSLHNPQTSKKPQCLASNQRRPSDGALSPLNEENNQFRGIANSNTNDDNLATISEYGSDNNEESLFSDHDSSSQDGDNSRLSNRQEYQSERQSENNNMPMNNRGMIYNQLIDDNNASEQEEKKYNSNEMEISDDDSD